MRLRWEWMVPNSASLGDGEEEIQDAPEVPVSEDWDESKAEIINDEEE